MVRFWPLPRSETEFSMWGYQVIKKSSGQVYLKDAFLGVVFQRRGFIVRAWNILLFWLLFFVPLSLSGLLLMRQMERCPFKLYPIKLRRSKIMMFRLIDTLENDESRGFCRRPEITGRKTKEQEIADKIEPLTEAIGVRAKVSEAVVSYENFLEGIICRRQLFIKGQEHRLFFWSLEVSFWEFARCPVKFWK